MKITHIKYKNEPYTNLREVITTYRRSKLKKFMNYFIGALLGGLALFILYICLTSRNDTKKMNECLQNHSLNYCNNNIN